jgi:hypothetical protein
MPTPKIQEEPITVQWDDPRLVDGEPAAAAHSAVNQLSQIIRLLGTAMPITYSMVRNTAMSEGLAWFSDEDVDVAEWWSNSLQKQVLDSALTSLQEVSDWAERIVKVYSDGR